MTVRIAGLLSSLFPGVVYAVCMVALLTACGSNSDSPTSQADPDPFAGLVGPQGPNLLVNGGFEDGAQSLDLCADAQVVTTAPGSAQQGSRLLRMSSSVACDRQRYSDNLLLFTFTRTAARVRWSIGLAEIPSSFTLSFYARVPNGQQAIPQVNLTLVITDGVIGEDWDGATLLQRRMTGQLVADGQWHRLELTLITSEDLPELQRGGGIPRWFEIGTPETRESNSIELDDVRLTIPAGPVDSGRTAQALR